MIQSSCTKVIHGGEKGFKLRHKTSGDHKNIPLGDTSKWHEGKAPLLNFLGQNMRLSTRAMQMDSLDPDSMWSRMSSTRHADYVHCTAWPRALARSTARSSDPDRGRMETKWSLNSDPRSASDTDPRSRVESPYVMTQGLFILHCKYVVLLHCTLLHRKLWSYCIAVSHKSNLKYDYIGTAT